MQKDNTVKAVEQLDAMVLDAVPYSVIFAIVAIVGTIVWNQIKKNLFNLISLIAKKKKPIWFARLRFPFI